MSAAGAGAGLTLLLQAGVSHLCAESVAPGEGGARCAAADLVRKVAATGATSAIHSDSVRGGLCQRGDQGSSQRGRGGDV